MNIFSIGNDIVDLTAEGEGAHWRFPSRILAPSEYEYFQNTEDPKHFLWSAWAAKEASFKCISRIHPKCEFSPRLFVFDKERSEVCFGGQTFQIKFHNTPETIHSVATNHDLTSIARAATIGAMESHYFGRMQTVFSLQEIAQLCGDQSFAVRALAKLTLSPLVKCEALNKIEILAEANARFPTVRIGGQLLPYKISLSHHGRYVAVAIVDKEVQNLADYVN